MVEIKELSQEEIERRERRSNLTNFLKKNTPKGFYYNGIGTFYDCPTFLHKATWAFQATAFSICSSAYGNKPSITVNSAKYMEPASKLAKKLEEHGLQNLYQTKSEEIVLQKN